MNPDQSIIIIGAGAFGLSTALALAKAGYTKITVFDRAEEIPAVDAASNDINKVVRSDYGSDTLYQGLAIESIKQFRHWNIDCKQKLGFELFHEVGIFNAASEESAKDPSNYNFASYLNMKSSGYGSVLEKASQIPPAHYPLLTELRKNHSSGYYNAQGGWADSGKSIQYVALLCRDAGVHFKLGIPGTIVSLVKDESGVIGVELKDGSRCHGTVILAAGAWSASLFPEIQSIIKAVGQPVIHIKVPADVCEEIKNTPVWAVFDQGYYGFPPNKDGIVKIARHHDGYVNIEIPDIDEPNESVTVKETFGISIPKTIISHPETGLDIPREALNDLKQFIAMNFPLLRDHNISATRLCWYIDSHDGDFYMCKVPQQSNFYLCTGGSGHGFKFLPVLGNIMLDVLEGRKTVATLRFSWRDPNGQRRKEQSRSSSGSGKIPNLSEVEMANPADFVASPRVFSNASDD